MNVRTIIKSETGKHYVVSTIPLSFDYSLGHGTPQLFETMVFARTKESGATDWFERALYATEDEAKDGHKKMVEKWWSMLEEG